MDRLQALASAIRARQASRLARIMAKRAREARKLASNRALADRLSKPD